LIQEERTLFHALRNEVGVLETSCFLLLNGAHAGTGYSMLCSFVSYVCADQSGAARLLHHGYSKKREDLARDRSNFQPHRQETRRMTHLKTIEILICHVHLASQSCTE
jgi:hypothetical protein